MKLINYIVKYCSSATSTAIIRVARAHYRMVWAALTFTSRLPKPIDKPCVVQVVRVSGTIKKSEEEAIRRARLLIRGAQRLSGGVAATNGAGPHAATAAGASVADDDDLGMAGGIEDRDEDGDEMEED
jgi:ribonuclease P/MRP protein subunit POP5